MFYVYILQHKIDKSLYKGFTHDLKQRLQKHKEGTTMTTALKGGDYELVWYCAFRSKFKALHFEKYLKSGSGIAFMKKRLVDS